MNVTEANGWLEISGQADMTFAAAGLGTIDMGKSTHGHPSHSALTRSKGKSHSIEAGPSGSVVTFEPYWSLDYMLGAFKGTEDTSSRESGPYFAGQLQTRVQADFGGSLFHFPINADDVAQSKDGDRRPNEISMREEHNTLYSASGEGGSIALSALITFGLMVKFSVFGDLATHSINLVDVSWHHSRARTRSLLIATLGNNRCRHVTRPSASINIIHHSVASMSHAWTRNLRKCNWHRQILSLVS